MSVVSSVSVWGCRCASGCAKIKEKTGERSRAAASSPTGVDGVSTREEGPARKRPGVPSIKPKYKILPSGPGVAYPPNGS